MAKTLEERAAGYVAKIRAGFEERHPYFAEGFEAKYRSLIDAALSEGRIQVRYATILRRALAGETQSEIAEAGGLSGQSVTHAAIQDSHRLALQNLRKYVSKHRAGFDKLYWEEIENVVRGNGHRPPTAYETLLYKKLIEARNVAEGLEAKLAEASGKEVLVVGPLDNIVTTPLMPIEEFGVPRLYVNSLERLGLKYVEQLQDYTREELIGSRGYAHTPDGSLRRVTNIGEVGVRFIETALGYLGYGFKGEEPKPFPTGEALRQSPTGLILLQRTAKQLEEKGIGTIGELVANQDELPALLRSNSGQLYRDVARIMTFYQAALDGLRTE